MEQNLLIVAKTLEVLGDIIIALVVLSVHMHLRTEKKIDRHMVRYMEHERIYVYIGILFIIVGYLLELSTIL